MCDCPTCVRGRRIEEIQNSNDPVRMKELISELHGLILNLETDNEHKALILSGKWPNSKEILEASLKRLEISIETSTFKS